MCGIIGIVGKEEVGPRLYDGLTLLQHRGQDAAGIATSSDGRLVLRRHAGLVRDVFRAEDMLRRRTKRRAGREDAFASARMDMIAAARQDVGGRRVFAAE